MNSPKHTIPNLYLALNPMLNMALNEPTTRTTELHWLTSNEHSDNGEYFLGVGVGGDVAEADAGEAGAGEVERRDIGAALWRLVDRSVDDRFV